MNILWSKGYPFDFCGAFAIYQCGKFMDQFFLFCKFNKNTAVRKNFATTIDKAVEVEGEKRCIAVKFELVFFIAA